VMAAPVISISWYLSVESVGSSFLRVIRIGSISVEVLVAPEVGRLCIDTYQGLSEAMSAWLPQDEHRHYTRQFIVKKASVFAIVALSAVAAVSAQATAPAPSPDAGAAFSFPMSGVVIGSSMLLSFVGLFRN
ncbi:hypothetical protein Tco_0907102, partial [Tanacetum coccineum]